MVKTASYSFGASRPGASYDLSLPLAPPSGVAATDSSANIFLVTIAFAYTHKQSIAEYRRRIRKMHHHDDTAMQLMKLCSVA